MTIAKTTIIMIMDEMIFLVFLLNFILLPRLLFYHTTRNRRSAATIQGILRILLKWFILWQFPIEWGEKAWVRVRGEKTETLPW